MTPVTIIVIDHLDLSWIQSLDPSVSYKIFPIGVSSQSLKSLLKTVESSLILQFIELPFDAETSKLVRNWMLDLSFKIESKITPDWRYLSASEKNSWKVKLPSRLYSIARLRQAIQKEENIKEILFEVNDRELKQFVSKTLCSNNGSTLSITLGHWIKFGLVCTRQWIISSAGVLIKWFLSPREYLNLKKGETAWFSFFPDFWDRPFESSRREKFFGSLPAQNSAPNSWRFWLWLNAPIEIYKNRGRFEDFAQCSVVLNSFSRVSDVLVNNPLGILFSLIGAVSRLRLVNEFQFQQIDVRQLIALELIESFGNSEFFKAKYLECALLRATDVLKPKRFLFRLEFQPFEFQIMKCLGSKSETIGYQHAAFSENFLSYFFSKDELAGNQKLIPDVVWTVGPYAADRLRRAYGQMSKIVEVGPARYEPLQKYISNGINKEQICKKLMIGKNEFVIFVGTSLIFEESLNLVLSLDKLIASLDKAPRIIIKTHPSVTFGEKLKREMLRVTNEKSSVLLADTGMSTYDLLSASDLAVLTGSSLAIEALLLGVLPLVLKVPESFANDPLEAIAGSRFQYSDQGQLTAKLKDLSSLEKDELRKLGERWFAFRHFENRNLFDLESYR
ncbi:MAG: hypothetical protein IT289_10735 [Oligoflexia bacterium]|nr:hypothetical protein [Oligoflexia bacterium]